MKYSKRTALFIKYSIFLIVFIKIPIYYTLRQYVTIEKQLIIIKSKFLDEKDIGYFQNTGNIILYLNFILFENIWQFCMILFFN